MIEINKEGDIFFAVYIAEKDKDGKVTRQFTAPGNNEADALANLRSVVNSAKYEDKNTAVASIDESLNNKKKENVATAEVAVADESPVEPTNIEADKIVKELDQPETGGTATTRDMVASTKRTGKKTDTEAEVKEEVK